MSPHINISKQNLAGIVIHYFVAARPFFKGDLYLTETLLGLFAWAFILF